MTTCGTNVETLGRGGCADERITEIHSGGNSEPFLATTVTFYKCDTVSATQGPPYTTTSGPPDTLGSGLPPFTPPLVECLLTVLTVVGANPKPSFFIEVALGGFF